MLKYTPMMEQYLAVKAEVPDAFLFFRLGDFYEMFFDDAVQVSRELELTLTGREAGIGERVPMCGVPHHAAETYISRLIEKGYKVAVCEQMEDASAAKGMVRREIVRIVTPGTLMEGKMLNEAANNYIAAVAETADRYGFSVCDLTTGELYVTVLDHAPERLADEITTYSPAEILASGTALATTREILPGIAGTVLCSEWSKRDEAFVREHFTAEVLDPLEDAAREAIYLIMTYLKETQKRSLGHITEIRSYQTDEFMTMDPFTRRNLELTETVRERSKKGSLLWLLDKTETAMGGRMLRRWIEKPLFNRNRIEERLEAVDKLVNRLIEREELRGVLREVYDLERLVARISYGSASGRDLSALRRSLEQIPAFKASCLATGSETLRKTAETLDECEDVLEWIRQSLVDEPPLSIKEGGLIKDGCHEHLDRLKEASRSGKTWIAELEKFERERTGIKTLKIGYNRVFGYYIEVTRSHLSSVPEGLYERKQTLANAERYITPELKEKESLILEAEEKMFGIEYELFCALRDKIAVETRRLQKLAEAVASVDVLQSFAAVSAANRYVRPVVTDRYDLIVEEGRHPVVETVLADHAFIANGTNLQREDSQILLITGPNMAGKSTYMRQVAVLCILAQVGCFVPAASATLPLVDRIFTRIGAADDLIGGQSTFMVEMMDIRVMTEKATPRSLVIIDELGRGTSTGEGMAIAQAVIEYLHNNIGCKTLVSTHFHELAHLEESLRNLQNYCMAVKESGQQVTFLRRLIRGAASTSYGIYCARIAGLPEEVIERSYALLNVFEARATEEQAALAEVASGASTDESNVVRAEREHRIQNRVGVSNLGSGDQLGTSMSAALTVAPNSTHPSDVRATSVTHTQDRSDASELSASGVTQDPTDASELSASGVTQDPTDASELSASGV
ncbi:MAG: DNA mismatch repair protein MutS, partial [Gorillibacterium sp.]|nr:DNA mismatch repair protein MutS [Gorillibacterium sp.]